MILIHRDHHKHRYSIWSSLLIININMPFLLHCWVQTNTQHFTHRRWPLHEESLIDIIYVKKFSAEIMNCENFILKLGPHIFVPFTHNPLTNPFKFTTLALGSCSPALYTTCLTRGESLIGSINHSQLLPHFV